MTITSEEKASEEKTSEEQAREAQAGGRSITIGYITAGDFFPGGVPSLEAIRIGAPGDFKPSDTDAFGGLIIHSDDVRFVLGIINPLRASEKMHHYLKPIFLYSDLPVEDPYLLEICDGVVDAGSIGSVFSRTLRLLGANRRFGEEAEDSVCDSAAETRIIVKVLRYMLSRRVELKPVVMPKSRFGYVYPLVAVHFLGRDDPRLFDILRIVERERVLDWTFRDRIHLCSHCWASFINFKEVCPRCGSADLRTDDLVHHFPCGHVAAASEYRSGDRMICPKCDKILRHIGMDYDRPSVIHACNNCRHTAQETDVHGGCFYCGQTAAVSGLAVRDINIYRPNNATMNFAVNGLDFSILRLLQGKVDLVDYPVFKAILAYEGKRQKRYDERRHSSVSVFQVENFQQLYMQLGSKKEQLSLETARILRETLRDSDVISVLNATTFVMLLLETPPESAHLVEDRLKTRFNELFRTNFPDFEPQVETHSQPLDRALEESLDD